MSKDDNIVLVVDDDRMMREMLFEYLTGESLTVELVRSGAEASARAMQGGIGVVIGDFAQPGMGGLEAVEHILRCRPRPEVVVLTSYGTIEGAVRALELGVFHYLQKPASAEALRSSVLRALESKRLAAVHPGAARDLELAIAARRALGPDNIDALVREGLLALQACTDTRGTLLVSWQWGASAPRLHAQGLAEDEARELAALVEEALLRHPRKEGEGPPAVEGPRVLAGPRGPLLLLPVSRAEATAALVAVEPRAGHFSADALARAGCFVDHFAFGFLHVQRAADAAGQAFVDELTGLYNARYFDVSLSRELASASAVDKAPPRRLSLLYIDVDQARFVNERFGHLTGSKVLVEMGRVLRRCVREVDPVFRQGGDDFAVLLRGADTTGALHVAERIRRSVETHPFLSREGLDLRLTISASVVTYPDHATSKERLVDLAEGTLHLGKRGGRNAVHLAEGAARSEEVPS